MQLDITFDVVDDNDNPLYQVNNKKVLHKEGLLHRGVNVLFYTTNGEIILQKRSLNKNTFPGLLDITVGGHVEHGFTYKEVALREIKEETGLTVNPFELQFIDKIRRSNHDPLTNTASNYFCEIYTYKFNGRIEDLKVEKGKAEGFISKNIDQLLHLTFDEKKEYTPGIIKEDYLSIFKKLRIILINPNFEHNLRN